MYSQINIRSYGAITLAGPTVGSPSGVPVQVETSNVLVVGITR
jgi:hypothetical protein